MVVKLFQQHVIVRLMVQHVLLKENQNAVFGRADVGGGAQRWRNQMDLI